MGQIIYSEVINMTDKKCIIFTGGDKISPAGFEKTNFDNAYIIAADSGCAQVEALNSAGFEICPHLLLGDMDSFRKESAEKAFPKAEFLHFPPEKDYTDTQLALEVAKEKGYADIEIIGGTGGRVDHLMANLVLLRKGAKEGIKLTICDGKNKVFYFAGGKTVLSKSDKYKYFSLLPDDADLCGVTIKGAKYNLDGAAVDKNLPITVSNEITQELCEIEIEKGACFIVQCSD